MGNYYVTKAEDKWVLTKEGNSRPSKTAATKDEIITLTHSYMTGKTASVKIHKQDGTIQEERPYPRTSNPRKSKG